MAITCKWKIKLATATTIGENGEHCFTFYGGGNCPFVLCYECENGQKQMVNFAIDKKSVKLVLNDEVNGWRKLSNIKLYAQQDKTAKKDVCDIAKALIELNASFTFKA